MSLSSELGNPTPLRDQLRRFPKPELPRHRPALRVPTRSRRPSYIGTAYDYLLRFALAHAFPQAVARAWVADAALERVREFGEQGTIYPFKGPYRASGEIARHIDRLLRETRRELDQWREGPVSERLARLALRVGQCDYLVRCCSAPRDFGVIHTAEVHELGALMAAADLTQFTPAQHCWLNPHFGCGSYALGGADCDLIVDHRLIEIKTTARRVFPGLSWNQLLGYAALSRLCPLNGGDTIVSIDEVGVYFARYNELVTWRLSEVIDTAAFDHFLTGFRACLAALEEHREKWEAKWARLKMEDSDTGENTCQSKKRRPSRRRLRARHRP